MEGTDMKKMKYWLVILVACLVLCAFAHADPTFAIENEEILATTATEGFCAPSWNPDATKVAYISALAAAESELKITTVVGASTTTLLSLSDIRTNSTTA